MSDDKLDARIVDCANAIAEVKKDLSQRNIVLRHLLEKRAKRDWGVERGSIVVSYGMKFVVRRVLPQLDSTLRPWLRGSPVTEDGEVPFIASTLLEEWTVV